MKKKLRSRIDTARQHCLQATPASVFIDGAALLMTSPWVLRSPLPDLTTITYRTPLTTVT